MDRDYLKEKYIPQSNETLKFLRRRPNLFVPSSSFLGQEILMNIGQNTAISNGDTPQKLAQFLIISDSQLYVPRHNSILLVVPRCISRKLQNLNREEN